MLLIALFTSTLHVLSLNAPDWTVGDVLADPPALILPCATLALGYIALVSRYLRAAMIHELGEDYATAARARGASSNRVLWHHVLRNALLPTIAPLGARLPQIFGAQLVVEVLFAYPGIGATMWNAAVGRDYYTMLGAMLISGVLTIVGSLVADLLCAVADPRLRAAAQLGSTQRRRAPRHPG
jgi:peptide/nickel transport system permease protein